ncbi:hydrogenase formation protein HypD [Alteromonas facilis]|uniref:hydrogenase formation protein HypD n=1 Tax=Alteromonas facilis TaxID=2048004 RepID=UPI000C28A4E5|nr:hydrogenase formation protein HypD [Alteromonas facilis]
MSSNEFDGREFQAPMLVSPLIDELNPLIDSVSQRLGRKLQIMEVCGGHTHAIFQNGLEQLISSNLEFVHGPGCPVCVLPTEAIDNATLIAETSNTILVTFGDVLRVPGKKGDLQKVKALGADIRVVYSPMDVLSIADAHRDKSVVFFAIGFDTTMPSIALTIQAAKKRALTNLSFLCYHIRLIPTLQTLLERDNVVIDGFIGPGHVSIVIGSSAYQPIAKAFKKPFVISGFEPVDILHALLKLIRQIDTSRCEVENAYARVVSPEGNDIAQAAIHDVFVNSDYSWQGLGSVPNSVTSLTQEYAMLDASGRYAVSNRCAPSQSSYCEQVLTGQLKPTQCPKFNRECTPDTPLNALMVSSEGACAAYYTYKVRVHA